MGRPERPLDPAAGPVQRLAHELRELRRTAGSPSYRAMAEGAAGFSATTLSQAAAGERLPSLAVVLGYVRACGGDPGAWEPRWKEAEAEAGAAAADDGGDDPAPYRGLARFEPDDHELFFGRDRLVEELCGLVAAHRFAAVFGASGSGKSSLLRAGFLPRLRADIARQRCESVLRVFTPGARPAETYGHLLTVADGEPDSWVVVDQFEEVFTRCRDEAERARFLDLLLTARDPDSRLRVLIAVRADFHARCAEHPGLAEALRLAGLSVGAMTADELREVVVRPAQAAGLLVERSLAATVVEEVLDRPGALPMLSHALLETWRRRRGRMLTTAAYEAAGGLNGAIAASAETVYGQLSAPQATAVRQLLLRLVEPGRGTADTGRPLTRDELLECTHPDILVVAERLARARLLTVDEEGVRLAHESLIGCWPRLRGWIDQDRERLRHHRQLTEAARAWLEHDRDPGTLYRGTRLARAEEMFPGHRSDLALTEAERAFLTAAFDAREAERRAVACSTRRARTLVGALSGVLAVALVTGLAAWRQHDDNLLQQQRNTARRVAAVADGLRTTDPRAALLLGVAAWRMAPLPETRRALLGSLAQPEVDAFSDPASGYRSQRFLADSGRTLLSVDDSTWETWNLGTRRTTASGRLPGGEVLAAGPDARVLAISGATGEGNGGGDGGVRLWDVRVGRWTGGPALSPGGQGIDFGASGRSYVVGDAGTGGVAGAGHVQLRSVVDGSVLFEARGVTPANVAPSADDRRVAVCPAGKAPRVLEVDGRRVLRGAWERERRVCDDDSAVVFGADGRFAVLAGGEVRVWDVRTGDRVAELRDPGVRYASFSRDGEFLATAGSADEIRVWRLSAPAAPALRHPLNNQHLHGGLAWDPGPPVLRYLEGGTAHSLDLTATVTAAWRDRPMDGVLLSPDGRLFATAQRIRPGTGSGTGSGTDTGSGTGSGTDTGSGTGSGTDTGTGTGTGTGTDTGFGFELRDTDTGRLVRTLPPPPPPPVAREAYEDTPAETPLAAGDVVPQMAFSPDGSRFVYGGTAPGRSAAPQWFTVWDLARDREQSMLDLGRTQSGTAVTALALSPDGRTLLTTRTPADGEPSNERWDTATRSRTDSLTGPGLASVRLALSPRDDLVVGDNRVARGTTGRSGALDLVQGDHISALAFSPDGSRVAAGDRTGRVALWDGDLRRRAGVLRNVFPAPLGGTPEAVSALALSPDGHTLAVGGDAGTIQLWDTATQQPLGGPLPSPGERIASLAFSPDNTTLFAGGTHVPLHRHTVAPARVVDHVCARAGNEDLTRAEWDTYVPDAPYRRVCH
ncbi:WD40 repeat domain-containing protein [Streptomyces europaeiscabiei]|uniref:WD40 repeat domain-containing protein n=1 Tax=Streptomyces europaeiscabiei TaxID=146819 RepID=UPI0029AA32BF|nr:WD40 repeat domain-containing protein [Streptomyces europaeiscabiei]MDX3841480.1 WD40 repeat domain-containing protein [Streptomyces europaeiscabiei]